MWRGHHPVTKKQELAWRPLDTLFTQLKGTAVVKIRGTGTRICFLVSDEGRLLSWDEGGHRELTQIATGVVDFDVGPLHVALIDSEMTPPPLKGTTVNWTPFLALESGRLRCLGEDRTLIAGGQETIDSGYRFRRVRCGNQHTLALTETGEVVTWGYGGYGQLGHGDTDSRSDPTLVEALAGLKVSEIACGGWHSVFLTGQERSRPSFTAMSFQLVLV